LSFWPAQYYFLAPDGLPPGGDSFVDEMTHDRDYSGMTANERFFASGLVGEFDAAARRRDRETMISILVRVGFPEKDAASSLDTMLANPGRYGS
jgi:hypothetical protein